MTYNKGDIIYILPNFVGAPEGLGVVDTANDIMVKYHRLKETFPEFSWGVYREYVILAKDLTLLEKALYGIAV